MKKSLLILAMYLCGIAAVQAQCTIQNSCTPTSGYCGSPASGATLPAGQENVPYSTTIQISVATSYSAATITNASVSINPGSLPTGLAFSTNPSNGIIAGGTDGCALISGTPATGTAGSYPVQIIVLLNTNFGQFPGQLAYTLNISASTGIATLSSQGAFYVVPNPAGSFVNLNADFAFRYARVFDGLGNLILMQEGINSTSASLDLSKLSEGIYFVQVSDGHKTITNKFVKQ